jgi:hypothetical protein
LANQVFSPVDIIPPWFPCSFIAWGLNIRHVGDRSSETYSHPIDMMMVIIIIIIMVTEPSSLSPSATNKLLTKNSGALA